VNALVAGMTSGRTGAGWIGSIGPRLSVAAALAVLVVGSALVVGPLGGRSSGSATASRGGPASAQPSEAPTDVHALGAAELGDLVRTRSAELAQRFAIVRATLTIEMGEPPCGSASCVTGAFQGDGRGFVVRVGEDLASEFEIAGSPSVAGPFVVRFTSEAKDGQPVLDALDLLIADQPDGWTSSVGWLRAGDPRRENVYAAVDGWLVRTPVNPCPSITHASGSPIDAPTYGCPDGDFLTNEPYQPVTSGGVVVPVGAIELPAGSYGAWAPDPVTTESGAAEPRRGVYLLHRTSAACRPLASCVGLGGRWGVIVARVEPLTPWIGPGGSGR
jgi:hypothetical protein